MKILPLLYLATSLMYLWGQQSGHPMLTAGLKPLLIPILVVWLIVANYRLKGPGFLRNAVIAALLLSTLGDILLMFEGALYFLLGLSAFLAAHICYTAGFLSVAGIKNGFIKGNLWWVLPFLLFPVLLLSTLWPGIPAGMKFPVTVYAGMISLMALSVLNLKNQTALNVFLGMQTGAILFMLSDSLIAIQKFGTATDHLGLGIMPTYLSGQFLLVWGTNRILKQGPTGLFRQQST